MDDFAPTDKTWPQFMRVNPILDWTYSEIWFFIRLLQLPYCSLYDQGYTSIDDTSNTVPNKELLLISQSDNDSKTYLPAYRLRNQDAERLSRQKK
jgi:FAD synthetase